MALYVQFKSGYEDFDIDTAIKEGIEDNSIRTWLYQGDYFTHKPPQWRGDVWIYIEDRGVDWVKYGIKPGYKNPITETAYSMAYGRFTEVLLGKFSRQINNIQIEPFEKIIK